MNHASTTTPFRSITLVALVVAGALLASLFAVSALSVRSIDESCARPPRMAAPSELHTYKACVAHARTTAKDHAR